MRLILQLVLAGTSENYYSRNMFRIKWRHVWCHLMCLKPDLLNSLSLQTCKSRSSISISKHKALCHSAAFSPHNWSSWHAPRYRYKKPSNKCIQITGRKNCIVQGHVQNTCEQLWSSRCQPIYLLIIQVVPLSMCVHLIPRIIRLSRKPQGPKTTVWITDVFSQHIAFAALSCWMPILTRLQSGHSAHMLLQRAVKNSATPSGVIGWIHFASSGIKDGSMMKYFRCRGNNCSMMFIFDKSKKSNLLFLM